MAHLKEQVILVDSFDSEIGVEEKLVAHQQGLLHRAFSIILYRLYNDSIQILIQKRNINKYHSGGLWSNTCCSHPRPGENIFEAAHRRLAEELNIKCNQLSLFDKIYYQYEFENGLSEHELDYILIGYWDELLPTPNYNEVETLQWVDFESLKKDLKNQPHQYTAWLNNIFEKITFD